MSDFNFIFVEKYVEKHKHTYLYQMTIRFYLQNDILQVSQL